MVLIIQLYPRVKCSLDTVDRDKSRRRAESSSVFKLCLMVAFASSGAIGLPRITHPDLTRIKKKADPMTRDDPFCVKFFRCPDGRPDYT